MGKVKSLTDESYLTGVKDTLDDLRDVFLNGFIMAYHDSYEYTPIESLRNQEEKYEVTIDHIKWTAEQNENFDFENNPPFIGNSSKNFTKIEIEGMELVSIFLNDCVKMMDRYTDVNNIKKDFPKGINDPF